MCNFTQLKINLLKEKKYEIYMFSLFCESYDFFFQNDCEIESWLMCDGGNTTGQKKLKSNFSPIFPKTSRHFSVQKL